MMNCCFWLNFGFMSVDEFKKLISFCQLHKYEIALRRYGSSFGSVSGVIPLARLMA